ncbi:FkbM family methyltransferase [Erythrobacteraceae bacterium CFH 75059]|uniref:FkbM family methyltransferase n=1 Tax=Qipengyuania thermophila TaxID=2509361 RepID=UPI00101EB4E4|nr:FkbM family methyltransferase [Qipengyuania thermophila]TCD06858.1 FkbM family methyltransferase [Erythrobacteraceae bacterium CFH 75059]
MSAIDRARGFIASRHGGFIASRLATVAEKYLKAYNNLGNMNMACNGEVRALRHVLARVPGDIIDAGSNEGQWAGAVLPFVTGDRTVHCFEPVPQTFARLADALGGRPRVRLNNAGLGAREGSFTLNFNPSVSEVTSAYPLVDHHGGACSVECRVTTGDLYLAEHGIAEIALLKIDVEGMEAECLAGFEDAFGAARIASVQFEHGPSHVHSGHTLKYFKDWFEERGFVLFRIFPRRLEPLRYELRRESFEAQNLLAVRRDLLPALDLSA